MNWFADMEKRAADVALTTKTLSDAEAAWLKLEDANILMEEVRNNGSWLRPWRRAIAEFKAF